MEQPGQSGWRPGPGLGSQCWWGAPGPAQPHRSKHPLGCPEILLSGLGQGTAVPLQSAPLQAPAAREQRVWLRFPRATAPRRPPTHSGKREPAQCREIGEPLLSKCPSNEGGLGELSGGTALQVGRRAPRAAGQASTPRSTAEATRGPRRAQPRSLVALRGPQRAVSTPTSRQALSPPKARSL